MPATSDRATPTARREGHADDAARRVLIVRHGEAYNNVPPDGYRTVLAEENPPLSRKGEGQAEDVVAALAEFGPDEVLISPFLRATQTAWPYLRQSGVRFRFEPLIGELLMGEVFANLRSFDPTHYAGLVGAALVSAVGEARVGGTYPEAIEDLLERVRPVVDSFGELPPGGRVAIVTHGGIAGATVLRMLGERADRDYPLTNGAVTELEQRDGVWHATRVDDRRHLRESGSSLVGLRT